MDNFEARYRAIVEKEPGLKYPALEISDDQWKHGYDHIYTSIARRAVRTWLEETLPGDYRFVIGPSESSVERWFGSPLFEWRTVCSSTDPADAILTAWEIILGIKEKA